MSHIHAVSVPPPWEEAVQQAREALGDPGFGIHTEIDARATFEAKLGIGAANAVGNHVILGASNPALVGRALAAEPELGALLPCNVVVQSRCAPRQGAHETDSVASLARGFNGAWRPDEGVKDPG
jgi:uncharacterized protein (DUF302 family)